MTSPLLVVDNITVDIRLRRGRRQGAAPKLRTVKDASLAIHESRTLGLVGESGSGKTTLAFTVLGQRQPVEGRILFRGRDINRLDRQERKRYRREAQMIFQDPSLALNPRMTLLQIVEEPILVHHLARTSSDRRAAATDLLVRCGISPNMTELYPHALSGGQKQRVALARALAAQPKLIVADEPTSALDVSIQSQILELLRSIQADIGISILFISHDLGVIRQIAHDVVVMSQGRLVEHGPTARVFSNPAHPYTQELLASYKLVNRRDPSPAPSPAEKQLVSVGEPRALP